MHEAAFFYYGKWLNNAFITNGSPISGNCFDPSGQNCSSARTMSMSSSVKVTSVDFFGFV